MKLSLNFFSKLKLNRQIDLLSLIVIFSNFYLAFSQTNPTQISNIFKGKIVGLGYSNGGQTFATENNLTFDCSTCQNMGNVYLFCLEINASLDPNKTSQIVYKINGVEYLFDSETRIGVKKIVNPQNNSAYVHLKKIDFPCLDQGYINFSIPPQEALHVFVGFYLVFECIDNNSDAISYKIIFNDNTTEPNVNILSANTISLNPIDLTKDVGFSVIGNTFNFMNGDASNIAFNNISLGTIGGIDVSSQGFSGTGVKGHFQYENGTLTGLDDDTEDDLMNGTDGLANVSSYLTANNSAYFSINHENLGDRSNYAIATILSYNTTCQEFPFAASNDTTICRNAPLQLSASGGTQYLWQPDTDLSCSTCPNPIFTGDSSRFYTVRIWNNDSCSVVRPVKVNVTQLPEFSSITTSASTCEGATGKIIASASLTGESYAINGGAPQATGNFFNLAPGFYTVTLQALNGCSKDSIVEVGAVISTNANFTANPAQGNAPLMVNFNNQSTNANNYDWFLNGVSQGNNYSSELFDSIGIYTVQLIAWQNDPTCADTAFQTISVTSAGF